MTARIRNVTRRMLAAVSLLVAPGTAMATAQPADPPADPPAEAPAGGRFDRAETIRLLVEELDAEAWRDRELATVALAISNEITFADLIGALRDAGGLSTEQVKRLRSAARRRFLAMPAPGLGVAFGNVRGGGAVLQRVIEGFPAARVLRAGDHIVAMHGEPVEDSDVVRAIILGHLPGESLPMTVGRLDEDGERVEVEVMVELASYEQLGNPGAPDEALRLLGFEARIARDLTGRADPGTAEPAGIIGGGLTVVDWLEREGMWPPPSPDTPIGETHVTLPEGTDASKWLALAGQPQMAVQGEQLRRANAMLRERRLARTIGSPLGSTAFEEVLAAYRITMIRVAQIDRQFLRLDGRDDGAGAGARANRIAGLRRERADHLATLAEFAVIIERGPDAPIE